MKHALDLSDFIKHTPAPRPKLEYNVDADDVLSAVSE